MKSQMVEMVNCWMENLVKIYMPTSKRSDMIEFVATHGTPKKHYSF
jgi:hypothetical protein